MTATSLGSPITLDFEGLPDGTLVTTQFPGLTFSNAIILSAGISLNEFEFPPFSGVNVASDNGGPISILFSSPVSSFAGYFTYSTQLTLTAFDAANNQVRQVLSLFNSNLALSGNAGSSPNELLHVVFSGGISGVTITGDPLGGSFVLDDATISAGVPEPRTIYLTLIGVALLARRRISKVLMNKYFFPITVVLVVLSGALWLVATPRPRPQETPKNVPSSNQPKVVVVTSPSFEPTRVDTSTPITRAVASPPAVGIRLAATSIVAGVSTTILVTSGISDPAVISNSVNLLRIGPSGSQSIILGQLHDDGLNGDEVANDKVYTLAVTFNEPTTTPAITLQIAAAFKGRLQRVTSSPQIIAVQATLPRFTLYSNSQQHLQLQYPSTLQPGQSGNTLTWLDSANPDMDPQFEIEVFTVSGVQTVLDVAKQALGDDFLSIAFYTPNGLLVRDTTSLAMHYFAYNAQTNRAVMFSALSPDYFSTSEFSIVSNSIQIQ